MKRQYFFDEIGKQFHVHAACGLLGPRQIGKTTLAKQFASQYPTAYFIDLEDAIALDALDQNPMLVLSNIESNLIVIDEVQLRPELFPILRVLIDRTERKKKFLILGSASRDLLQQSSETLAGRIGYIELFPFSLSETTEINQLWLRGGFPLSYLAQQEQASVMWRRQYISTFMERDIPALGFNIVPVQMRRLWLMLTHYHGGMLNVAELSKSLMLTEHLVRKYIDILAGTFMIRLLQPWYENISKRQVKTPKIYIRDSGLLHSLLNIEDRSMLNSHPRLGASWEGFALEEVIKSFKLQPEECFFWRTQDGAELDLLVMHHGKRLGFEFKYADVPRVTKSMHSALQSLNLDHLYVIHPHENNYQIHEKITVKALQSFIQNVL